ncbi:MAG TPA: DoxX family protein [Puia sp.]|nr:DoxX family protein [Puia sp.]
MSIILYLGCLLAGFLISLFWKPADRVVTGLSKVYLYLVLLSVVSTWIFYFAGIKNAPVLRIISEELSWTGIGSHMILGYLLGRLASGTVWSTLNTTLWAMTILYGNTFIVATVGKSTNMPEMISFFKQSGYAVWFLYFIMAAETAGAIGVLTNFRLRLGPAATICLMVIMLGAVYTHWHNGDPFSDSYAAVSQLITGSLLLFLYSRRTILVKNRNPK